MHAVTGRNCGVRSVRATSELEVIHMTERLPASIESIFQLEAEQVKQGGYSFFRYELPEAMCWASLRSAVSVLSQTSKFDMLRKMFIHFSGEDYSGLFAHLISLMDIELTYEGVHPGPDKLVYSRRMLWANKTEQGRCIAPLPGIEYIYSPQKMHTLVQVSYTSPNVWNWIQSIKYQRVDDFAKMASFKPLEAIFAAQEMEMTA